MLVLWRRSRSCRYVLKIFWKTHSSKVTGSSYSSKTDSYGFVGVHNLTNSINVVFRGTIGTSVINWINNFKISSDPSTLSFLIFPEKVSPYPDRSIKIHSGFWKSWSSIRTGMLSSLTKAQNLCPSCKIVLTGHSLGGAMATLAAKEIVASGKQVTLVTFGSPRIGNDKFASMIASMKIPTRRFVCLQIVY